MEALLSVQTFFLDRPNLPNSTINDRLVSCVHARHFVPGSLWHRLYELKLFMLLFVCLTHRPPPYYYKVGINEVRCVSRSVEGLHSLLARVLKRAPAAKVPYISFEMRSAQLAQLGYQPAVSFLQLIHRHTKTHTHCKLISNLNLNLSLRLPLPFKWTNCFFIIVTQL